LIIAITQTGDKTIWFGTIEGLFYSFKRSNENHLKGIHNSVGSKYRRRANRKQLVFQRGYPRAIDTVVINSGTIAGEQSFNVSSIYMNASTINYCGNFITIDSLIVSIGNLVGTGTAIILRLGCSIYKFI
jgi:restriction endonuclease S subunit